MNQEKQISVAKVNQPDPFDEAFAENLALVLEMLDCMRSESEFVSRQDEAAFLGGIGKALATFARVRSGSDGSRGDSARPDARQPLRW